MNVSMEIYADSGERLRDSLLQTFVGCVLLGHVQIPFYAYLMRLPRLSLPLNPPTIRNIYRPNVGVGFDSVELPFRRMSRDPMQFLSEYEYLALDATGISGEIIRRIKGFIEWKGVTI